MRTTMARRSEPVHRGRQKVGGEAEQSPTGTGFAIGPALDLIRKSFLFAGLPDALLAKAAAPAVTRTIEHGTRLFAKGDPADGLHGVLAGKVRISVQSAAGKEVLLNILEPGAFFGEIALLDGQPRTADASAIGKTTLVLLRRRDFLALLDREPAISRHLMELLCQRLRWTSALIEDGAFLDLSARLAKRLLRLADVYGKETDQGTRIALRLSQQDLGDMLGATREAVNKQLQALRRSNIVAFDPNGILLRDRAALENMLADAE